ncbi:MAG: hypothetical protein AB1938_24535 [Myxococcota bacterium]
MRGVLATAVAVWVTACGPVEYRIDETKGVPAVTGSTEVQLGGSFTCGTPITSGQYTVSTKVVTGGCEFSFDQDVEVLKASDYQNIPDLAGASNLVQRVELKVKKLSFADGQGQVLDVQTRITSATLSVNGQVVADKATLARLPATVSLQGDALAPIKAKVDARQPASVRARCVVVLPDDPAPPEKLKIDYDAQPAIILGPGKII